MLVNADIVVSNVFSKKEELKAFIDEAIFCGYQIKVIKCYKSFGTVHGVPESTIADMAARWEDFDGEELVNYGDLL